MSSGSDDSLGGFIRSYADRVRAEALEKAAELTSTAPPKGATGTSLQQPSAMPPPASLPPPSPGSDSMPSPALPAPPPPPSFPIPTPTSDKARSDHPTAVDHPEGQVDGTVENVGKDEVEEIEVEEATEEENRTEASFPPLPAIDLVLDDSTVADLEDVVEDTRVELRQRKRELRQARHDARRQRRYERRFGPEGSPAERADPQG